MKFFLYMLFLLNVFAHCLSAQVKFSVSTNKPVYEYGEDVYITVKAINTSNIPDTLRFIDCHQSNYKIDSFNLEDSLAWCLAGTRRFIQPQDSIIWDDSYPPSYFEVPLLNIGVHAVIGEVVGYWSSDTLWIEVETATSTTDNPDIPLNFRLENNYPNPFNPSTRIEFSLPFASPVKLQVFNLLGSEVAILANQKYMQGKHSVTWDAHTFPSGVYFYRLQAGLFIKTKSMVLLK